MKKSLPLLFVLGLAATGLPELGAADNVMIPERFLPATGPSAENLRIAIVPFGPTQGDLDALSEKLASNPAVHPYLGKGVNYRHLYTELVEPDEKVDSRPGAKRNGMPAPPTRFQAVYYDYTNQRAIVAEGLVADPASSTTARVVSGWQPDPSQQEYEEAVATILLDPTFGPALQSGELTTYHPMPPIQERDEAGNPPAKRIVHVGLSPKVGYDRLRNEIVGVDLGSQQLKRFDRRAPLGAIAQGSPNCGVSSSGQASTSRGTAGQYQLTVTDPVSGIVLWDMLVVRPSASSGTRASGIEVRNVSYRGHTVLKRGHVPILNVKYDNDACGPYRDWQYQEGQFAATGTDVTAGFRDCGTTPATTALENGTDVGNFRGVAVYRQGSDVVMVTELEAGWYRYIHEWRFDTNGTIRPRFGFGATTNSCTCLTHHHHVYFRLDVDVDNQPNTIYQIPFAARDISDRPNYAVNTERRINRVAGVNYFYRIRGGKRSYLLFPGANDGIADTYGRGDMWLLQYKSGATNLLAEIDDGNNSTGGSTEANLDQFVNGESLAEQDVVIWTHGTVTHSPTINSFMCTPTGLGIPGRNILTGDKVVGPDLVPEQFY